MRTAVALATSAALLLAAACTAEAQDKVSDGVIKIGLIEDMSSKYADITGGSAGSRRDRASSAPSVRG